jgi:hypothetical protein
LGGWIRAKCGGRGEGRVRVREVAPWGVIDGCEGPKMEIAADLGDAEAMGATLLGGAGGGPARAGTDRDAEGTEEREWTEGVSGEAKEEN